MDSFHGDGKLAVGTMLQRVSTGAGPAQGKAGNVQGREIPSELLTAALPRLESLRAENS